MYGCKNAITKFPKNKCALKCSAPTYLHCQNPRREVGVALCERRGHLPTDRYSEIDGVPDAVGEVTAQDLVGGPEGGVAAHEAATLPPLHLHRGKRGGGTEV